MPETTDRPAASPYGETPLLRIVRLREEAALPTRAHPGDAGLDLRAAEAVVLPPGERALVGTGVAVALPAGTVGLIHPRSGLAVRHGLTIVNAPGTVDVGYRGEIKVCLLNTDRRDEVRIDRGDRIAQLVIQPVVLCEVLEVPHVHDLGETSRGFDGYGSTGGLRHHDESTSTSTSTNTNMTSPARRPSTTGTGG